MNFLERDSGSERTSDNPAGASADHQVESASDVEIVGSPLKAMRAVRECRQDRDLLHAPHAAAIKAEHPEWSVRACGAWGR